MTHGLPIKRLATLASLAIFVTLAGCGSDDLATAPPTTSPNAEPGGTLPIATRITLAELALMQALKVPLAKNGRPAERGLVPLVAGRDALARLYVKPDHDSPQVITARIQMIIDTPTGQVRTALAATKTVAHASTESDLESTINVPIPGRLLQPTTRVSVTLHAAPSVVGVGATGAVAGTVSAARYPTNGDFAALDARPGGEPLRLMLVPVRYDADGSHRMPDVSAEQLARYRQLLYKLFPVSAVEITVHEPFPWDRRITGDRAGFAPVLEAIGALRGAEGAQSSVFYHGIFAPTADPRDLYVGVPAGSTLAGLAAQGSAVSVGVGYSDTPERGDQSAITAAHEIGHAHGLFHAPCGGPDGPDPDYPTDAAHAGAAIGAWGYDQVLGRLVDPGGANPPKDLMGYCAPRWISDYHLGKLIERSRADAERAAFGRPVQGLRTPGAPPPWDDHDAFHVGPDGEVIALPHRESGAVPLEYAVPRTLSWKSAQGATLGHATARFFPYDHASEGELWVPRAPRGAARAELEGAGAAPLLRFPVR